MVSSARERRAFWHGCLSASRLRARPRAASRAHIVFLGAVVAALLDQGEDQPADLCAETLDGCRRVKRPMSGGGGGRQRQWAPRHPGPAFSASSRRSVAVGCPRTALADVPARRVGMAAFRHPLTAQLLISKRPLPVPWTRPIDLSFVDDANSPDPGTTYRCLGWHTPGIGTAKRPQRALNRHRKANSNLSPRYVHSPGTAGNKRENPRKHWASWNTVLACSRLFPALGTAKGPQERRCGPFRRRVRTFDADPSARHIFAFSQSAATVISRPPASLTIVSRRTLNSPRSIAP